MIINTKNLHLISAIRLIFASTIGLIIGYLTNLPHSVWIVISIVVVLFDQSTVGGTIQKGIFRASATILSALISIFTLYLFKNNILINDIVFILCLFVYAYYFMGTKKSYIGVIGSVTIAIILLGDVGSIEGAVLRSITILLGVILAALSMLFFFPQYANKNKNQLLTHLLSQLENTLNNFMNKHITFEELHEDFIHYESTYLQQITLVNRLIDESKFEIKLFHKRRLDNKAYQETILHFRRINRLVGVLIHHLPNSNFRFNYNLAKIINDVIAKIKYVKKYLTQQDNSWQNIIINKNEYAGFDTTDQDLLFAVHTIKHISSEIDLIIATINK